MCPQISQVMCPQISPDLHDSEEIVNVGVGNDVSIKELAETVKEVVGYKGVLKFDT